MVVPIQPVSRTRPQAVPELPAIWNFAPDENDANFLRTYRAISLAIQTCLRERVPQIFLSNPRVFEIPSLVYPILMYAASRPFRPKTCTDLTYDPLDNSWLTRFLKGCRRRLSPRLREIYARLDRKSALSRRYGPRSVAKAIKAVRRYKKSQALLASMVAGEAALVGDLVRLAGLARRTERERNQCVARFFVNFRKHLRPMCPGCNLTPLAPVLLDAATQALASALKVDLAA